MLKGINNKIDLRACGAFTDIAEGIGAINKMINNICLICLSLFFLSSQ